MAGECTATGRGRGQYVRACRNLLLLAVLLTLVVLARSWVLGNPHWRRLELPQQGFAVHVLGTPDLRSTEEELAGERLSSHYLSFSRRSVAYAVTWTDLPLGQGREYAPDAVLQRARDALARSIDGRVIGQGAAQLEGYPGQWWHAQGEDGTRVLARAYVVRSRLYTLVVSSPEASAGLSEVAGAFFDSFGLLPAPGADGQGSCVQPGQGDRHRLLALSRADRQHGGTV